MGKVQTYLPTAMCTQAPTRSESRMEAGYTSGKAVASIQGTLAKG